MEFYAAVFCARTKTPFDARETNFFFQTISAYSDELTARLCSTISNTCANKLNDVLQSVQKGNTQRVRYAQRLSTTTEKTKNGLARSQNLFFFFPKLVAQT
jgi:hypothetical protein